MRRQPQPEASPEVKAAALAALEANGGNAKQTAAQLGMPLTTLRYWAGRMSQTARGKLHKDTPDQEIEELAGKWQKLLRTSVDLAQAAMDNLTEEQKHRLQMKDIRELTVSGAIATEKMQLLRGRPTQQLAVQDLASFLKNSTESGTGAAPVAAPALSLVPRSNKAG